VTFQAALTAMQAGQRVRRAEWFTPGQYMILGVAEMHAHRDTARHVHRAQVPHRRPPGGGLGVGAVTFACARCGGKIDLEPAALHLSCLALLETLPAPAMLQRGFLRAMLRALVAADQGLCAKCLDRPGGD
jgi:hypothetical protein